MKKKLRHRNVRLQGLALLLSVVLLFVYMPIAAVAEVIGSLTATEEVPVEEVYEVTALREAGVKHFYVGERKYTAVSYGEAVHRQDATGTWQEIDNTLTLQNGKYRTPDGRVQLAATNSSDNLLQLTENGYSIGLSFATGGADNTAPYALQSVNTTAATVQNATREAVLEGDSPAVQYEKLSRVLNRSSLQYANLMANTDVRYTLHGNDVTGRITLRGQRESYNVALRLQLVGLTPSLDEAGNVILSDATTGTAVYTIPAPGISTPGLVAAYQLLPVSDGLYLLGIATTPVLDDNISTENFGSLTPGGENTAVTLSFGVVTGTGTLTTSAYACGYIDMDNEHSNYTTEGYMYMRGDNVGYLCTDLPGIPQYTTLSSAELDMWYSPYSEEWGNAVDWTDTTLYTMRLYKAAVNWFEMDDWTFYIADVEYEQFGLDMSAPVDTVSVERNDQGYVTFEVTSAVAAWYNGSPNYGLGVINGTPGSTFFLNEDHSSVLEITYRYTTVDVPEGNYYIQNVKYKTSLSADTKSSSLSVTPKLEPFAVNTTDENDTITDDSGSQQQWRVTSLGSGFYEIESTQQSGWVLTAGTSQGEAITVQPRSTSLSTQQQWTFEGKHSGVSIKPRSSVQTGAIYSYCLGAQLGDFRESRNICLYSNLDATDISEMWLFCPAEAAINGYVYPSGLYYIDNAASYNESKTASVQVDLNSNASSAKLVPKENAQSIRSQWQVTYLYNGYYSIVSVANDKALTVSAAYENQSAKPLALLPYVGTANQQWKFTAVSEGGYKVTPRCAENYSFDWCMSASMGTLYGNYGENVEQLVYSAARGRWMLTESTQYIVNLNIFYDQAYAEKYANAEERILANAKNLQEFYFSNFNIFVNYSIPREFYSTADWCHGHVCDCTTDGSACPTTEDFAEGLVNITEADIHCHNFAYMAYSKVSDLKNESLLYVQNSATVIYSGHEDACINYIKAIYTDTENKELGTTKVHSVGEISGATYRNIVAMTITTAGRTGQVSLTDEEMEQAILKSQATGIDFQEVVDEMMNNKFEGYVLLHEFGHIYNVPDHYYSASNKAQEDYVRWYLGVYYSKYYGGTVIDHNCTYGNENASNYETICSACREIIFDHRSDYRHSFVGR